MIKTETNFILNSLTKTEKREIAFDSYDRVKAHIVVDRYLNNCCRKNTLPTIQDFKTAHL